MDIKSVTLRSCVCLIYISGVLHFPLWMLIFDLLMITCSILLFLNLKRRKDIRFDCCSLINECLFSPRVHYYFPSNVATLSSVSFFSFFKTHRLCRGRGSVPCVSPGLYVVIKISMCFLFIGIMFRCVLSLLSFHPFLSVYNSEH